MLRAVSAAPFPVFLAFWLRAPMVFTIIAAGSFHFTTIPFCLKLAPVLIAVIATVGLESVAHGGDARML